MRDDELFRYLERDIKGDKAVAAAREVLDLYNKYMAERAPAEGQRKLDALANAIPSADPNTLAATAWTQVSAEGLVMAVVGYLARHDKL